MESVVLYKYNVIYTVKLYLYSKSKIYVLYYKTNILKSFPLITM